MSLSRQETKDIRVMLMIEVIGKPPEHLIETLEGIIKNIDEEKGVVVKSKKIKEPTPIEDFEKGKKDIKDPKLIPQKGFFSSFAEIEVEVEEILNLAILMFKYMPAHIEIISPELIALTNNGWNDILNELMRRLHGYDEIARVIQVEKVILERKLREILEEQKPVEKTKKKILEKKGKK